EANRLLGRFPADFLQNQYRQQFGGLAKQQFDEARRTGDLDGIADVATRYFHTEAGYEAANYLGTLHLDRGEFSMAALWFQRLLEARVDQVVGLPQWRFKAALALRQAGQSPPDPDLLQTLTSPGRPAEFEI